MPKIKTHPWDPADHIVDGEGVLAYLKIVTPEQYDPVITPLFLDCIARSKGVAEISGVNFHEHNGNRSVTVTTTNGASTTIPIAADADADSIKKALTSARSSEPIAP